MGQLRNQLPVSFFSSFSQPKLQRFTKDLIVTELNHKYAHNRSFPSADRKTDSLHSLKTQTDSEMWGVWPTDSLRRREDAVGCHQVVISSASVTITHSIT